MNERTKKILEMTISLFSSAVSGLAALFNIFIFISIIENAVVAVWSRVRVYTHSEPECCCTWSNWIEAWSFTQSIHGKYEGYRSFSNFSWLVWALWWKLWKKLWVQEKFGPKINLEPARYLHLSLKISRFLRSSTDWSHTIGIPYVLLDFDAIDLVQTIFIMSIYFMLLQY